MTSKKKISDLEFNKFLYRRSCVFLTENKEFYHDFDFISSFVSLIKILKKLKVDVSVGERLTSEVEIIRNWTPRDGWIGNVQCGSFVETLSKRFRAVNWDAPMKHPPRSHALRLAKKAGISEKYIPA